AASFACARIRRQVSMSASGMTSGLGGAATSLRSRLRLMCWGARLAGFEPASSSLQLRRDDLCATALPCMRLAEPEHLFHSFSYPSILHLVGIRFRHRAAGR